jgi:vacuolar iron transporter family protein
LVSLGLLANTMTMRLAGRMVDDRHLEEEASDQAEANPTHVAEPHSAGTSRRLNALRAAVLGANDGIVSVAGIVIGVAGATSARAPIFTAGLAGLMAGAVSMALGEYISVSSQLDSETALVAKERRELHQMPDAELAELTAIYEAKGLSPHTAAQVAGELTTYDALAAHADAELNINPKDLANPWQAAAASAASFAIGAQLPLLAILLTPTVWRVPVTFLAVLTALALAGALSAYIGGGKVRRAVLRVVIGGAAGLTFTYGVGHLFGAAIS